MNALTNLNALALTFITEGNSEGMQQCVKNSIQPKMILQAMFDAKRYECLPAITDLLRSAFQINEPIAAQIYVDLLERNLGLPEICLSEHDKEEILQLAVRRKVRLDFNVLKGWDKNFYYRQILVSDCVELFLHYQEKIMRYYRTELSVYGPTCLFPRILKLISVDEESCKKSLEIVLDPAVIFERERKYAMDYNVDEIEHDGPYYVELLRHLCSFESCRDIIYTEVVWGWMRQAECELIVQVAAEFDPRIASKVKELHPELHARIFCEDV